MLKKRIAIIMAGGAGERFWPLSRFNHPKQLLKLANPKRSMLQQAVDRLLAVIPAEDIFVVTGKHLKQAIQDSKLPIPQANILAEPTKRNTGGCLVYAVAVIASRYNLPENMLSMAVVTADHNISPTAKFAQSVTNALDIAEQKSGIVTIGIMPNRPDTGYGYMEIEKSGNENPTLGFKVKNFHEKPNLVTAKKFFKSGNYYWNSGMFFWTIATFLEQFKKHNSEYAICCRALIDALQVGNQAKVEQLFSELPAESIDYALLEKADRVYLVPANFSWDDIGSWDALDRTMPADEDGNVCLGNPIVVDSKNCIVYNSADSAKMEVAVIGCENIVVVSTEDGILVVDKSSVQDVKQAVIMLKQKNSNKI